MEMPDMKIPQIEEVNYLENEYYKELTEAQKNYFKHLITKLKEVETIERVRDSEDAIGQNWYEIPLERNRYKKKVESVSESFSRNSVFNVRKRMLAFVMLTSGAGQSGRDDDKTGWYGIYRHTTRHHDNIHGWDTHNRFNYRDRLDVIEGVNFRKGLNGNAASFGNLLTVQGGLGSLETLHKKRQKWEDHTNINVGWLWNKSDVNRFNTSNWWEHSIHGYTRGTNGFTKVGLFWLSPGNINISLDSPYGNGKCHIVYFYNVS